MNEEMDAFAAGMTFQDYVSGIRVHRAAYLRNFEWLAGALEELRRDPPLADVHTLAIVEDWCPDCVFNVPVLARLAEASDAASLRIVRRPDHPLLANRFTGRGGVSRVPTFVFLRPDGRVIGHWSERSAWSQQWFDTFASVHPIPAIEIHGGVPAPALMEWMQLRIARETDELHAGRWREVLREVRAILQARQPMRSDARGVR